MYRKHNSTPKVKAQLFSAPLEGGNVVNFGTLGEMITRRLIEIAAEGGTYNPHCPPAATWSVPGTITLLAWCDRCKIFHRHGTGRSGEEPRLGTGVGIRGRHCASSNLSSFQADYELIVVGFATIKQQQEAGTLERRAARKRRVRP